MLKTVAQSQGLVRSHREASDTGAEEIKRLRILHADTDDLDNPLAGGQPVRTFAVNSRLSSRHDITVVTSVYQKSVRRMSREGVDYRRLGIRIPKWGLSPHLSYLASIGPATRFWEHDLFVEEFMPPFGFCGAPWWTRKPVVLIVQWYFFEQWEKRYRLPFRRLMAWIASKGRYRYVIVQTEAMMRELQPYLPNASFRVIPCGIDDDAFSEGPSEGDYALYMGRLDMDHKGLDMLIDSWEELSRLEKVPLVIAGDGPAKDQMRARIEEKGLARFVRFAGRISGKEKKRALRDCRFMVVPSRYETFGISALEAMAAAKPVVCFDIPHLNEVVGNEWGVCVPSFDVSAFAKAALDLWRSPALCKTLGSAGQSRARSYRWDEIAARQEEFYLELVRL